MRKLSFIVRNFLLLKPPKKSCVKVRKFDRLLTRSKLPKKNRNNEDIPFIHQRFTTKTVY